MNLSNKNFLIVRALTSFSYANVNVCSLALKKLAYNFHHTYDQQLKHLGIPMNKQLQYLIYAILITLTATQTTIESADTEPSEAEDQPTTFIDKSSLHLPKLIPTGAIRIIRKETSS